MLANLCTAMLSNISCPSLVGVAPASVFLVRALERCSARLPATAVGRCACRSCCRICLSTSDRAKISEIEIRYSAGHDNILESMSILFPWAVVEMHGSVSTPVFFSKLRSCICTCASMLKIQALTSGRCSGVQELETSLTRTCLTNVVRIRLMLVI